MPKERKATRGADALDQATICELYCRYTVVCSLPFSHIKQHALRDLIRYIRKAADDFLPRPCSTVKGDLQRGYITRRSSSSERCKILFPPFTSLNCLAVIGFTVQFVTEDHGLLSLVVGGKELDEQHSGENMSEAIMEFIREYGIACRVS